jgi:hypothetical protein
MTYTSTQQRNGETTGRRGGRRGFATGTTEARPGIMTTEFWLSLAMAAAVIVAGYVSDAFSVSTGWALGAGLIAAYAISRGLAKAGSREGPFLVDLTDDDR